MQFPFLRLTESCRFGLKSRRVWIQSNSLERLKDPLESGHVGGSRVARTHIWEKKIEGSEVILLISFEFSRACVLSHARSRHFPQTRVLDYVYCWASKLILHSPSGTSHTVSEPRPLSTQYASIKWIQRWMETNTKTKDKKGTNYSSKNRNRGEK